MNVQEIDRFRNEERLLRPPFQDPCLCLSCPSYHSVNPPLNHYISYHVQPISNQRCQRLIDSAFHEYAVALRYRDCSLPNYQLLAATGPDLEDSKSVYNP